MFSKPKRSHLAAPELYKSWTLSTKNKGNTLSKMTERVKRVTYDCQTSILNRWQGLQAHYLYYWSSSSSPNYPKQSPKMHKRNWATSIMWGTQPELQLQYKLVQHVPSEFLPHPQQINLIPPAQHPKLDAPISIKLHLEIE